MHPHFVQKRELFEAWCRTWLKGHAVHLVHRGDAVDARAVLEAIRSMPPGDPAREYVYILLNVDEGGGITPRYIGRAADPPSRWRSHLENWMRGRGAYARWKETLLDEQRRAQFDLRLLVVPVSEVKESPIPGFPVSVGSLEYQLVGLASDAFPDQLLNHEGRAR